MNLFWGEMLCVCVCVCVYIYIYIKGVQRRNHSVVDSRGVAIEGNKKTLVKESASYILVKRVLNTYYEIAWKLDIGE